MSKDFLTQDEKWSLLRAQSELWQLSVEELFEVARVYVDKLTRQKQVAQRKDEIIEKRQMNLFEES